MDVRTKMFIIFVICVFVYHFVDIWLKNYNFIWDEDIFFAKVVEKSAIRLGIICVVYLIFL